MGDAAIPPDGLEFLRGLGDPELLGCKEFADPTPILAVAAEVRDRGLHGAASKIANHLRALAGEVERTVCPDAEMLREAQRLFGTFATEISGALLLAALPQSYAAAFGARVLASTGELAHNLVRRVRGTAQFLLVVTQPTRDAEHAAQLWRPSAGHPGDANSPPLPWQLCIALRVYHEWIRRDVKDEGEASGIAAFDGTPLNQEDLLGMLLTFSVTVFEVLERYGISWTADEQEAYLHLWDVVGGYLGVGSRTVVDELKDELPDRSFTGWHGLRPPSIAGTRALLEEVRQRQWVDPGETSEMCGLGDSGPTSFRDGRLLTSALLDELVAAMPSNRKLLPITMMRALNPDVVRRRLSLGNSGVLLRTLGQLPLRRHIVDRFTSVKSPNRVAGRILRGLANEVSSRATVRFLREPGFVIPGLEEWSYGYGLTR